MGLLELVHPPNLRWLGVPEGCDRQCENVLAERVAMPSGMKDHRGSDLIAEFGLEPTKVTRVVMVWRAGSLYFDGDHPRVDQGR